VRFIITLTVAANIILLRVVVLVFSTEHRGIASAVYDNTDCAILTE
jgi:hypothetical protein